MTDAMTPEQMLAEVQKELRMGNVLYAQLTEKLNDKEQALAEAQAAIRKLLAGEYALNLPAVQRAIEAGKETP